MSDEWEGLDRDFNPGRVSQHDYFYTNDGRVIPVEPIPDTIFIGAELEEKICESIAAYLETDEGKAWARNPSFQIVNAVPSPDREIIALRKKVAELEERLKTLEDSAI